MKKVTLEVVLSEMKKMEIRMGARFDSLEGEMNSRFEQVDKRFEQVDKRFEQVDKRFEQVDKRHLSLEGIMNSRFASVDLQLKEIRKDVRIIRNQTARLTEQNFDHERRITKLEKSPSRGNA